jgi:transcriptional regulator with XRE-family HTH domain
MARIDVPHLDVRGLGDYIREQRSTAQISLRQLAALAGVSNPYLSQIERGLRKPSAEILQQIAKALRISAEALYVQAGILEEHYVDSDVPAAVFSDPALDERQKQVLLEMYQSFRQANDDRGAAPGVTATVNGAAAPAADSAPAGDPAPPAPAPPAKKAARRRPAAKRAAAGRSAEPTG